MSLIKLSFNFSKATVQMEPCKPIMVLRFMKDPQFYHYDDKTGEMGMVRSNKNDGGK